MNNNEMLVSIKRVGAATALLRKFRLYFDNDEFLGKIKNVDEKLMGNDTPLILFPMGYEKYLHLAKYLWGHTEHQNDNKS